jgi:hypothetical protein
MVMNKKQKIEEQVEFTLAELTQSEAELDEAMATQFEDEEDWGWDGVCQYGDDCPACED